MFKLFIRGWLAIWNLFPVASGPTRAIIIGAVAWPTWHGVWNWLFGPSRESQIVPGVNNATIVFGVLASAITIYMVTRRRA